MRRVLITGANRGLGLEFARQSLERGHRVRRRACVGVYLREDCIEDGIGLVEEAVVMVGRRQTEHEIRHGRWALVQLTLLLERARQEPPGEDQAPAAETLEELRALGYLQ